MGGGFGQTNSQLSPSPVPAPVTPAPLEQPNQGIPTPKAPSIPAGMSKDDYSAFKSTNPDIEPDDQDVVRGQLAEAQSEYQRTAKSVQDTIANIQNGTTPLSAGENAQLDGLKSQMDSLIRDQQKANDDLKRGTTAFDIRSGVYQYSPKYHMQQINDVVTKGLTKVSDLQIKEAAAVAELTQSFKDNDIKAVKDSYAIFQDASKERQTALKDTIKETQDAIKEAQTAKIAADKVVYDQVTKPIQEVSAKVAAAGAPPEVKAKIAGARTVQEAIDAAGPYLETATGTMGEYVFYKQQALAAGVTPQPYEDWNKAREEHALSLETRKAYAIARASAEGKASVDGLPDTPTPLPVGLGGDKSGGSILTATGLSVAAFNFLTQGTASMSRMTAAQRNQIMKEAEGYLNRTGTDISTFQSQYKAYNDVLQKNISRANQTKIMAGEVEASADALISSIEERDMKNPDPFNPLKNGGLGNLRPAILLDLMVGKQVNDPIAMKYASQLTFMANDLAGYLAAARGASSPELQDQRDAAEIVSNGLSKRSVEAFRSAITTNENKVAKVVEKAVDSTRKQVWGLFGVDDKFTGGNSATDATLLVQQQAKDKVDAYLKMHPDKIDSTAKLYESGGYTDEQVAEYLNL